MLEQKKTILVWDIPVRVLHWALTILIFAAFGFVAAGEEDPYLCQIHMLLGIVAVVVVALRLLWGIFGSSYARFGTFLFGPRDLWRYLKQALARTGPTYVGHNPGSSWAIYAMLLSTLGLGLTGLLMATGVEVFEELHGPCALLLLLAVAAHLAGIVWHTFRHREQIALSMVHGQKQSDAEPGLRSAHAIAGVAMLALIAGSAALLFAGHDPAGRRVVLPLIGTTIKLAAGEDGAEGQARKQARGRHGAQERHREHAEE